MPQSERDGATSPRKEGRRKSPKTKKLPPASAPAVGGEDDEGWTTVKKSGRKGAEKPGGGAPVKLKGTATPRSGAANLGRASSHAPGGSGGALATGGRRGAVQEPDPSSKATAKPAPPTAAVPPTAVPFGALNEIGRAHV